LRKEDIEITAPVGSFESLMAAIQAGADSVYFGIDKLNMRAASSVNFTLDDLSEILEITKEHNIKSYITLNSVIFNDEIDLVKTIINSAKESGVSGIIASDFAVILYANSRGVEVHCSTQCNISNIEAVRFFSRFADVMVLARELNLEQVKQITETIEKENINGPSGNKVKIEVFAHGALCMAISGKCYLSLHNMNSSANRGECLQLCRRPYHVTDKDGGFELEIDNEYIMSPKDLCTVDFLDKIVKAGVKILKIEGRGRSPEYVKTVTSCYREAIESVCDGTYNEEKIKAWKQKLGTVYNRGFWDGYYLGRKLGEWTERYGSQATTKKIYVGKITNYFSDIKVAEVKIESNSISVGDNFYIMGRTTGVYEDVVKEIRVDLLNVETANKCDLCSIPVNTFLRRSDKLYKIIVNY
jgi:U32 family peptidase